MNCKEALYLMADLESDGVPSPALGDHLAECDSCRSVFRNLTDLVNRAVLEPSGTREKNAPHVDLALTARIMEAIRKESTGAVHVESARPLRLPGWSAGAVVLVASLVLIQYSQVVDWLRPRLGSSIDVSLGIMLGVALTIYICVLVGSNLAAVQKLLHLRHR